MKVVILCGGYGTRIRDVSDDLPKPMIPIGEYPIIWHIMKYYASFGHQEFILCLGYKSNVIKDYFLNYEVRTTDFSITLGKKDSIQILNNHTEQNWKITFAETGIDSMTGTRVKKIEKYIDKDESFMLTYGDGLADIDISKLIDFHKNHKKIATITAVRPPARFGELELDNEKVLSFKEKPQLNQGWINGGFMVLEPEFIDLIDGNSTLLEREPLELVASKGELMAYRHDGFWQCMDTKRDKELLENLYLNNPPWIN